jgi:imidazolonepropionase
VIAAGRLARCDGEVGGIDGGAVYVEGGLVVAAGPQEEILARAAAEGAPILLDLPGALITPGLVDAHTHAAWVGSRHEEYALRLSGAGYEQIAAAGGGIRSTMRAVAQASLAQIEAELAGRLRRMAALGVTTVEVKSGYGLDRDGERKQLTAIAACAGVPSLPRVVATYLALHAIPPSFDGQRAAYVAAVGGWIEEFAPLVRSVDAYVDRSAFTVDEAREVLGRARARGLGVRLHAGQFADVGAAELAGELGALSADHLEHIGPAGMEALARAGTAAVLLPVASFTLGQAPPPVRELSRHGVRLVVASDANPGTAPTESLPLALAMAARSYGLSPAECLLGATCHAARALGLDDGTGTLRPGAPADLVVWGLPHETALIQPWGAPPVRLVVRGGVVLHAG